MDRKYFIFITMVVICIMISGCGPSADQAVTITAAVGSPTPKPTLVPPTATYTLIPPTATLIPPTPTNESSGTLISLVKIVNHESMPPAGQQLWLEFAFNPGDILPGSQIEAILNNGTLELVMPGGENKSLAQVPHSPTEDELSTDIWLPEGTGIQSSPPPAGSLPLNGRSFENYADSPNGPQIRIAVENLSDLTATGQYQITWQSGDLRSNSLVFDWNGKEITIP